MINKNVSNYKDNKSNDLGNSKDKINEGEDGIRSRLRKNPNKTKYLYTGDLNDQKSKKKNDVPSAENVKEICRSILEVIKKDEKSILFRQPAIKSFSLQKDKDYYKKRIKEPRDLGYISKKLKLEEYTLKNFYDDMELCWSNALEFNDSNTEAYLCAVYLKELSNKLSEAEEKLKKKETKLYYLIEKTQQSKGVTKFNSIDEILQYERYNNTGSVYGANPENYGEGLGGIKPVLEISASDFFYWSQNQSLCRNFYRRTSIKSTKSNFLS